MMDTTGRLPGSRTRRRTLGEAEAGAAARSAESRLAVLSWAVRVLFAVLETGGSIAGADQPTGRLHRLT